MLFRSVSIKMHKKVINFQNGQNGDFGGYNFFWCVFKNTEQNNNHVFIVLKKILGCFSSKTKSTLFLGENKIVLNLKF